MSVFHFKQKLKTDKSNTLFRLFLFDAMPFIIRNIVSVRWLSVRVPFRQLDDSQWLSSYRIIVIITTSRAASFWQTDSRMGGCHADCVRNRLRLATGGMIITVR